MKRLLIGCIALCFAMASSYAEEIDIKLIKEDKIEIRSLSSELTATHDDNIVHIYYSDYLLENLQVIVKDLSGEVVYSNTVSVSYNQPYSFTLNNVESGEYKIELVYGTKLLYGYFSI